MSPTDTQTAPWEEAAQQQSSAPADAAPWEEAAPAAPAPSVARGTAPAAAPAAPGRWSRAAAALAHTVGLPGSQAEADQMQQQEKAETLAHPFWKAAQIFAGPAGEVVQGAYAGGKRILGELTQAGEAVEENNPAGVGVHAVQALPFVGEGIKTGAEQLGPGEYINLPEAATALGTAATAAPMLMGGEGGTRLPETNYGVYIPREPKMLPGVEPPVTPEYVGEPAAPSQGAGIPDAEVEPWLEPQQGQIPAKAGPGLQPPPPVNRATAIESTKPPAQFAPRPDGVPNRGAIVDAQGNVLVNRPGLPPPGETAARKTPIIPKIVPPPAPVAPAPPQPTSNAVMVSPPSNIQPAPESPQAAPQTPPATIPPSVAPNAPAAPEAAQRPAVQASGEPAELRQSAQDQKPILEQAAQQVAAAVPGAEVVGPRVKSTDSIENKDDRGKPPETNIDNLGVRVVAPNPDAVPAVQQAIESQLPVVQKDKIDNNGLNIPQYGVQTGKPGEPNQVSELQVIPGPAVAKAMKETDDLYAQQKEAQADLDAAKPGSWQHTAAQKEVDDLGEKIKAAMDKAKAQDAKQPENQGRAALSESKDQTQLGNPAPAKPLTKGTPVTLKDGTAGTIKGGNPNEPNGGRWMVNTPKGSVLANGKDITPADATANVPQTPPGPALTTRVEQIKALAAKGTPVKIFTARAGDPEVTAWVQQNGLGDIPVTNVKGHDFGALLDNEVNVSTNQDKPFEMPEVPAGKALYVDLDGTLAKEPGHEQRISAEQPAGNAANGRPEEAQGAIQKQPAAQVDERQPGQGGREDGGRVQPVEQGSQPAGESAVQAKPGGEENRPKERYEQIVGAWLRRAAMDQQGQGVLDDMIENGESPRAISDKFWEDTYWKLPGPVQERFQKQLSAHWGGMKPGDTIGSRPDKSAIVARDWWDLTKESDLPTEAEYLEGTDRGYVVLMREANERFGGGPEKVQKGTPEKKPDQLTGGEENRGKEVASKPSAVVNTIAGKMDLDEFERNGYAPEQVTREDWTNLQRAARRAMGQSEESGTRYAPYADYEGYHKSAVEAALKKGEEVDPEVLKDYPDLKPAAAKAVEVSKNPVSLSEKQSFTLRQMSDGKEASWLTSEMAAGLEKKGLIKYESGNAYRITEQGKKAVAEPAAPKAVEKAAPAKPQFSAAARAKDRADRDAEAQAKRETEEMERAHTAELQERFTTEMRDRLARAKFTPGTMIPRGPKGELPEVKGDTLGGLIVHKAISERTFSNKRGSGSDWEVSHIPSGLAILRGLSNRDNAKIAAVRLADIGNWNRPQKELEADKDLRGRGAELAKAVREGATAMTPNDLKAMEARPVPEKAPVAEIAPKSAPVPVAAVKADASAVAPGTEPPSELEQWKAELAAMLGKDRSHFGKTNPQVAVLQGRIADAEHAVKTSGLPLTEPEEKLVTDPDKNKWKYQAEYFVKALEPVKDAWLNRQEWKGTRFNGEPEEAWKYLVKNDPGGHNLPAEFPNEFIRIEVPNDGKFLVKNRPEAIDRLLKSAPSAFAEPTHTIPGTAKRSVPRAPKEMDQQALIKHLKGRLDEAETDWARANEKDEAFHKEEIASIKKELAAAQQAAKGGGTALTSLSEADRYSAAILPLETNAIRSIGRLLPQSKTEPHPAILLNANSYAIIHKGIGIGGTQWDGITLTGDHITALVDGLIRKAEESNSIQGRRNLAEIAKRIVEASREGHRIILYAGEPRPDTVMEEQFHGWQVSTGVHIIKAVQDAVLNTPVGSAFAEALTKAGNKPTRAVLASEVAAKAVTGTMLEDGFTENQRGEVLKTYFDAIAQHSPNSLDNLPAISDEARQAIQSAKEQYGKVTDNDSTGAHGLHEPGGRPIQKGDESGGKETELGQGRHGDLLDARAGTDRGGRPKDDGDDQATGKETLTQRAESKQPTAGASDRAGVGKLGDLGTKFYSGFGDPQLFNRLFPDIGDRMADWLSDAPGHGDTQRAMMRETRGEMDRKVAIAIHKLKDASKEWRTRTRDDSMKFWNAVESGTVDTLAPRDQALANLFKGAFDSVRGQLQALKPEVLQDYIENYFPHIWERPSQVSATIKALITGKKPFAGKGSFLKQRTIPTMQDGIDLGFKPVSWNPVDSFLTKYAEMAQFLMGHQTLKMMQDSGTAKMVRIGKQPPEGWTQLDDRIGTVQNYDDEGHLYIRGHYYAPAEAARIFNNFVSRGMAGRSTIYDTLNWANQNLNALQLGISAFHASTTSINAATSDVALGIQQLAEGKPLRAGLSLAKGASVFPSLLHTMVNGSRLMREYLTPGSYAKMAEEAKALASAGGRIRQNTIELKPLGKVINAWRNGAVLEGLTPIPAAILHAAVAPVMDFYVPRMKLGAFYGMAHDILDSAQKQGWSEGLTRSRMQEAWDSIDNRFGQVVYDNLFWHKGVRDALNLATRSVGWNFGSYRELGGAVADVGRQAGRAASGQIPRVTPRLAFGIALPLVSALFGGILSYLWTGKRPQTWKDYFYPETANGQRHSIPGYMKDVFSFAHDPIKTALNKMAPIWEATAEAINNRDFYGTEIRHKDDPLMAQLGQFSRWAGSQAVPFSVSGAAKLLQQRGAGPSLQEMLQEAKKHPGDVALGQLGFQPAPAFIQNSEAINQARQYSMENRPPGTKTQDQAAHYAALDAVVRMYREDEVDQKQIDKYVDEGKLTDKDVAKAERESDEEPIARAVKNLTIEQMLNVWAKATADEREAMEPILERHEKDIDKVADDEQREKLYDAFDKAMGQTDTAPATTSGKGVI